MRLGSVISPSPDLLLGTLSRPPKLELCTEVHWILAQWPFKQSVPAAPRELPAASQYLPSSGAPHLLVDDLTWHPRGQISSKSHQPGPSDSVTQDISNEVWILGSTSALEDKVAPYSNYSSILSNFL